MTLQRLDRPADQALDDELVEARGDDREAQIARQVIAFQGANGVHGSVVEKVRQYSGVCTAALRRRCRRTDRKSVV